jgi:hypothetical protein
MSRRSPEKNAEGMKGQRARRSVHHRRYGYRGYGSGLGRGSADYGGRVHWGSGFGGVGVAGVTAANALPRAALFEGEALNLGPYFGVDAGEDPREPEN